MSDDIAALLREIRDQQRLALERQSEAIALQREHMALYVKQLDRVERINDRAESLQARAGRAARLVLWVAIPLLILLMGLMLWPYLRALAWRLA